MQKAPVATEEIRRSGDEIMLVLGHRGAQAAPDAVAVDGGTRRAGDGEGDDRGIERSVRGDAEPHRADPVPPGPGQGREGRTVSDRPYQAERRFRPRERRDCSTARPPRVRIRRRKPCVFFRLRLLGWNVRFTAGPPQATARRPWKGTAREAWKPPSLRVTRSACNAERPGSPGVKMSLASLVAPVDECYVARHADAPAGAADFPGEHRLGRPPGGRPSSHDLHTCGSSCG